MSRFWNQPERGMQGDHGQDGRQGERGETGARGPAGSSSDGKQGERGVRGKPGGSTPGLRLRLLVLYLLVIVLLGVVVGVYRHRETDRKHFEHAVIINCRQNQDISRKFNATIHVILARLRQQQPKTPAEAAQVAEGMKLYGRLLSKVPTCPPGPGR